MNAILPKPYKFRLSGPGCFGAFTWEHIQTAGDPVYRRDFYRLVDVENFMSDRYGKRFAKLAMADLALLSAD